MEFQMLWAGSRRWFSILKSIQFIEDSSSHQVTKSTYVIQMDGKLQKALEIDKSFSKLAHGSHSTLCFTFCSCNINKKCHLVNNLSMTCDMRFTKQSMQPSNRKRFFAIRQYHLKWNHWDMWRPAISPCTKKSAKIFFCFTEKNLRF